MQTVHFFSSSSKDFHILSVIKVLNIDLQEVELLTAECCPHRAICRSRTVTPLSSKQTEPNLFLPIQNRFTINFVMSPLDNTHV
ncbi:hypothetical protein GDO78_000798 [Eleutherodactylus coqui]|uniref:Uncharacterized protein n=1 Tax=Eleutherodactylus coqui TaxID=57060 RepID=A0A8J6FTP4_ELECQ|nr:hypothetical protein GDO78_000798 [Eleutherodactylus coqui]